METCAVAFPKMQLGQRDGHPGVGQGDEEPCSEDQEPHQTAVMAAVANEPVSQDEGNVQERQVFAAVGNHSCASVDEQLAEAVWLSLKNQVYQIAAQPDAERFGSVNPSDVLHLTAQAVLELEAAAHAVHPQLSDEAAARPLAESNLAHFAKFACAP